MHRTAVVFRKIIVLISMALVLLSPCFAADNSGSSSSPVPYEDDEFPDWAKDLRHAEIVGFGSMPFISIGVTLVYGGILYATGQTASFPNPLDKSSSSFTSSQTKQIFGITFGAGVLVGITDFSIRFFGRKIEENNKLRMQQEGVSVEKITEEELRNILLVSDTMDEDTDSDSDEQ